MRRLCSRWLCALLVVLIALAGLLGLASVQSGAELLAPAGGAPAVAASPFPPSREPSERAFQLAPNPLDLLDDLCDGLDIIRLPGEDVCTHGPDPVPPGFDIDEPVQKLSKQVARELMQTVTCDGDGRGGYRVQVLYVQAADVLSHYDLMLPSLRGWVGEADQIFQASAAETNGKRHVRFVHDADCLPTIPEVVVAPRGDDGFGATIGELRKQGYTRRDRIYLAFVDTTEAGICGIGTMWSDDRRSNRNRNNSGPSYARVDAGCWDGSVAAHELMHNLGGVQDSAPHATGAGHCIDEYDVMCYRDSRRSPPMRVACPDRDRDTTRFDCGHDDYFHTHPPARSYLATHWNPAHNRFLIGGGNSTDGGQKNKKKHK